MLEDATEGDDLTTALVDAVTDDLINRVVGRGDALQRAILVGLLDAQLEDVEAVIDLEVVADMTHVQGIEPCLCLTQCRLHLAGLQHLGGVVGRHA